MNTTTQTNQTLNVKKVVAGWLAKDTKGFNSILNNEERISAYRISQILEAYADGTNKELPPIRYAPQSGQIEDGRHRVFVAWVLGVENIQADLVWAY